MDCASMMLDVEGVGAVNGASACTAWFSTTTLAQPVALGPALHMVNGSKTSTHSSSTIHDAQRTFLSILSHPAILHRVHVSYYTIVSSRFSSDRPIALWYTMLGVSDTFGQFTEAADQSDRTGA